MRPNFFCALLIFITNHCVSHAAQFDNTMVTALEMVHNASKETSRLLGERPFHVGYGFRCFADDSSGSVLFGGAVGALEGNHAEGVFITIDVDEDWAWTAAVAGPKALPENVGVWCDATMLFAVEMVHNAGEKIRDLLGDAPIILSSADRVLNDGVHAVVNLFGMTTEGASFHLRLFGELGRTINVALIKFTPSTAMDVL